LPYREFKERVDNYDLAVIPDVVKTKFEARKEAMVDGQNAMQSLIVDFEKAVRSVLDENGILGVLRVPYLNLARACFRAKGHQSGLALRKIAAAEKAKALQMGLDPTIVDEIITKVIGAAPY